jgi:hypothetical protein
MIRKHKPKTTLYKKSPKTTKSVTVKKKYKHSSMHVKENLPAGASEKKARHGRSSKSGCMVPRPPRNSEQRQDK